MGGPKKNKKKSRRFKYYNLMKIIAGVDEVGRGSLVGPVYAAAVILKSSINTKLLKDSKSISSACLLYTSPSPRDRTRSRMPSSA